MIILIGFLKYSESILLQAEHRIRLSGDAVSTTGKVAAMRRGRAEPGPPEGRSARRESVMAWGQYRRQLPPGPHSPNLSLPADLRGLCLFRITSMQFRASRNTFSS